MTDRPLRIAIVAGEESGDLLGADLVAALRAATGRAVELVGVGGPHLQALGLKTLFDPGEISLMGIAAVVTRLPQLFRRIGQAAAAVVAARPDCLITIDVPDFSLRVARKVRDVAPDLPTIHYVCPSVWAWRPERAPRMASSIDHVLCLLPFEVGELARLSGPPATYVGHRLSHEPRLIEAAARQRTRPPRDPAAPATLLVLPGSRRGEVSRLLEPFRETIDILAARGTAARILLPTVSHVEATVRAATAGWRVAPEILTTVDAKYKAFGEADAALAASGTVTLELALGRVPTLACYKADRLMRAAYSMIGIWTASLPNLVADGPVVPEFYDHFVRPGMLARHLELLLAETPARAAQLAGFDRIAHAMATDRPSGVIAAEAVLSTIEARRNG
ncbi:lipid-A-disaccharide synthase [Aquibium microcysteis]|uniref:lipid-A-disaccharide synthase n=1 Tax=Aquibium microcysteis TaxID=675281 RepID=UPI00165D1434|nr:lipid-A-disaccharide synthase [Aquibium microcysteis]